MLHFIHLQQVDGGTKRLHRQSYHRVDTRFLVEGDEVFRIHLQVHNSFQDTVRSVSSLQMPIIYSSEKNCVKLIFLNRLFEILCLIYQHELEWSFRLFYRLNDDRGKEQFEISLKQVFVSLNALMHENSDSSLVIQGAALRYFPTTISDVITVYDPQQFR